MTQELELQGTYTWELLFDIDNSGNAGEIRRKEEVRTSLSISYESLLHEVQNSAVKTSLNVNAKWEVVSVSMHSGLETSFSSTFEKTAKSHKNLEETRTKSEEFVIGANSVLKLYRLVFHGPGISCVTDTLSSTPSPLEAVRISCTVRPMLFLKEIDVVYTEDAVSKPENSLQEIDGGNADINAGFGGKFVWLVPIWTTDRTKAATSVEIIAQKAENSNYEDLAKGAGGEYRYLKIFRDPTAGVGITRLRLLRTMSSTTLPSTRGWKHCTGDINMRRKGDFLYLCWEAASTQ
jgi:hypothetical protein